MRAARSRARAGAAGFTLIEVLLTTLVLGLVLSSMALVGLSNRRAFDQGAGGADLEVQVRRVVDHAVQELRRSGVGVLDPDPVAGVGAHDFAYLKAAGVAGGATTWSTPFRLYWDYEVGEIDDGVDNNGNGLIDEGRVLWVSDFGEPDERVVVICHNVREYLAGETANSADDNGNGLEDERGFCVERVEDAVIIRLTLETTVADSGLQARTIETSVRLRN
jgi:prepilin-type N-terminal cleavage/methylation domain-containing protein